MSTFLMDLRKKAIEAGVFFTDSSLDAPEFPAPAEEDDPVAGYGATAGGEVEVAVEWRCGICGKSLSQVRAEQDDEISHQQRVCRDA